jgi:hypothetical protein
VFGIIADEIVLGELRSKPRDASTAATSTKKIR